MTSRPKRNESDRNTASAPPVEPSTRKGDATKDDALAVLLETERKKKLRRRLLTALLMAVVLAGSAVAYTRFRTVQVRNDGPRYVTAEVVTGNLHSSISSTGTVEALNTVEVGAEISGPITALNADFNDTVTEGQVLATIDPEQLKASLDQAKAQVLAAEAKVAEAEATLVEAEQDAARTEGLAEKGLTAPKALESAKAAAIRAKAALKSAKASAALAKATYDAARSKLSKTEIVSPISGLVLSREVEVGQTINAGMQTPVLFVIAEDLKRMRLSSRVDEADIGAVVPGLTATFTVDAYPDREFRSEVTAVRNVPEVDQNVVSYEVLLSVDNRELLLKPGMTASVEIVTATYADVLLVPSKALRFSPSNLIPDRGFRGPPIPFFGRSGGGRKRGEGEKNPLEAIGKLSAKEGVLWQLQPDKGTGPAMPLPVKVQRLATDGNHTAVRSDALAPGDRIIVDETEQQTEAP